MLLQDTFSWNQLWDTKMYILCCNMLVSLLQDTAQCPGANNFFLVSHRTKDEECPVAKFPNRLCPDNQLYFPLFQLMEIASAFGPLAAYRFLFNDELGGPCAFLEV